MPVFDTVSLSSLRESSFYKLVHSLDYAGFPDVCTCCSLQDKLPVLCGSYRDNQNRRRRRPQVT